MNAYCYGPSCYDLAFSNYLRHCHSYDLASSVDCGARVQRNFRFRGVLPVCAEGGHFWSKSGGLWAVFGGFSSPQVVGRRQHLMGNLQTSPDF